MAKIQTAFRLDDDDLAFLDEIMRRAGMSTRSDAVRYVLRMYAKANGIAGFEPPAPRPKAKRPAKRKR